MKNKEKNLNELKQYFEEVLEDLELFEEDEKKELKKKKFESGTNTIYFSELFLSGYDTFYNHSHLFKPEEKKYLEKFKDIAEDIRKLLGNYGGGKDIGDYYVSQKIKDTVNKNRLIMNDIIILFSSIFLEND